MIGRIDVLRSQTCCGDTKLKRQRARSKARKKCSWSTLGNKPKIGGWDSILNHTYTFYVPCHSAPLPLLFDHFLGSFPTSLPCTPSSRPRPPTLKDHIS